MAVQCDGRVPLGLPCLAESITQREIPKRRDSRPAGEGKLPLPATGPTAHGVSGGMCWQMVPNAACTGSSG